MVRAHHPHLRAEKQVIKNHTKKQPVAITSIQLMWQLMQIEAEPEVTFDQQLQNHLWLTRGQGWTRVLLSQMKGNQFAEMTHFLSLPLVIY